MIQGRRAMPGRTPLLMASLFLPLVVVGLVSFFFIRSQGGDGGAFAARQQHTQVLSAASVAKVVRKAPDPISNENASEASCTPLGSGPLRDPWRCVLHYPTGRVLQYRVTISTDGSYTGDEETLLAPPPRRSYGGTIDGCCIAVP